MFWPDHKHSLVACGMKAGEAQSAGQCSEPRLQWSCMRQPGQGLPEKKNQVYYVLDS